MAAATTPPLPGSMTVPPLFGWEHILVALLGVVVVTLAALVLLAVGRGGSERSEWRAWLDERSARRRYVSGGPVDGGGSASEQASGLAVHPAVSRPGSAPRTVD
jgi:hypothetical protein